jgi:hypothetical protein
MGSYAVGEHPYSFVWGPGHLGNTVSKGEGTFTISPAGGTAGFYIGSEALSALLADKLSTNVIAWRTNTVITAVQTNETGSVTGIVSQALIYLGTP